jgi:hypothetical protein
MTADENLLTTFLNIMSCSEADVATDNQLATQAGLLLGLW